MSQHIPEETLNQIQAQVNIVDIISQYVQLKKRGKNYFGHCPFHDERTPSFSVAEEKQIYHCFSCGRGGSVFSFIAEIEGLTFVESVAKVVELAQLPININVPTVKKTVSNEHARLMQAHQLAQDFYQHVLLRTRGGDAALTYLEQRGYTSETIETFGMGFSLKDRTYVTNLMQQIPLTEAEMEETGLFVRRQADFVDRFYQRIMIPLRNAQGQVVAFSGRVLPGIESDLDDLQEAKYLNSPETPLFNKRNFLFNFDLARAQIRKQNQVVLYEGYMDVIAAWQAGAKNGVASMGTSLTQEQVATLSRVTNEVVIAYDGDRAGLDATNRAIELLQQAPQLKIAILPLEDGMDPDEFIQARGAQAYLNQLEHHTESIFQFKKRYLMRRYRIEIERERVQFLEQMVLELAKLTKPIEREVAIQSLAQEFNITPELLASQVESLMRQQRNQGATHHAPPSVVPFQKPQDSLQIASQKQLLYRLIHSPEAWSYMAHQDENFVFPNEDYQQLFLLVQNYREMMNDEFSLQDFLNYLDESDTRNRNLMTTIEWLEFPEECSEQEIHDLMYLLSKKGSLQQQYQQLLQEMKEAQLAGNNSRAGQLMMQLVSIQKQLKK